MKLETVILITKGLCYVFIGFTAPLGTALAQWANEGSWPPRINLVVIGGVCIGSAAASLLAFLSGSYNDYIAKRNGGNTAFFQKPTPPPADPKP